MEKWNINDSAKIYNLDNWGADLFSINKKGNICVHPSSNSKQSIDLRALMDDLIKRKIKPPILLRFMDVLQGRIATINRVFKNAIAENDYPAKYQTFYPIKVNQQRQVVEAIASYGKRYNIGLEVGSKPELVAGISISTGNGLPIICNGYKDTEYHRDGALRHQDRLRHHHRRREAVRTGKDHRTVQKDRHHAQAGHPGQTLLQGDRQMGHLRRRGRQVRPAHVRDHRRHRHAGGAGHARVRQAAALPHRQPDHQDRQDQDRPDRGGPASMPRCGNWGSASEYLDIGGGLGVDYDGSKSSYFSSVNYTIEEYANDVIYQIKNICDEAGVECPNIISESGRATVAHYSVLVTNVLNTNTQNLMPDFEEMLDKTEKLAPTVKKLVDIYKSIDRYSLREDYHDTLQLIQEAVSLFNLGYLTLNDRAIAEWLYSKIIKKINGIVEKIKPIPEELQNFQLQHAPDLFRQFFPVPVDSRLLGHRPALPDRADPAPQPEAGCDGLHRRHHLRLGRRDHQLRRRERPRPSSCRCTRSRRTRTTTSASS